MKLVKKMLSLILAAAIPTSVLAGCSAAPVETTSTKETVPADYRWATYYSEGDEPFLPKDIFTPELYVTGFTTGDPDCGWVERTDREDTGAFAP